MKITQDYIETDNVETIEVVSAEYKQNYDLNLTFSNGTVMLIDFRPFLSRSLNPSITKYLDKTLFRNFEIISGNLNWNDYDLIFPVEDLYQGKII